MDEIVEGVASVVGDAPTGAAATIGMTFGLLDWARLLGTGGVVAILGLGVAHVLGVPAEPGFNGSLLAGPGPGAATVVGLVVVALGLTVGRLATRSIGIEAAVFVATVGLWALSLRCGPVRPVLQYAAGRGVWLAMASEDVLLGAALVGGWVVSERRAMAARAAPGAAPLLAVPNEVSDATAGQKAIATAVAVLVTGAVELVLIQTDAAAQCLAGVGVAALVGTIAGYMYLPLGEGAWYWAAPILTALIGYAVAFATGDGDGNGDLHGFLGALARPTPLHAASIGVAAGIVGHWCCRRWAMDEESPMLADPDAPVP